MSTTDTTTPATPGVRTQPVGDARVVERHRRWRAVVERDRTWAGDLPPALLWRFEAFATGPRRRATRLSARVGELDSGVRALSPREAGDSCEGLDVRVGPNPDVAG